MFYLPLCCVTLCLTHIYCIVCDNWLWHLETQIAVRTGGVNKVATLRLKCTQTQIVLLNSAECFQQGEMGDLAISVPTCEI